MELPVEQIIEELSKIDVATENVISSADLEKKKYAEEMDQKTKDFDSNLVEEMNKRLESYKTDSKNKIDATLKQYRHETDQLLDKLDHAYEENHEIWSKQIFNSLVKE